MSAVRARVAVQVETGVQVRRAEAIHGVLVFALDVLRLSRMRDVVDKGVRDNPWISSLTIVGFDGEDRVAEELLFEIDWETHRLHMSSGRDSVVVPHDRSLAATVSPDLLTALRLFKEACLRKELLVECYVARVPVPGRDTRAELGLGKGVTLRYAGAKLSARVGTGELDEMSGAYNRYGPT